MWCLHHAPIGGVTTRDLSKITGLWMVNVYWHLGQLQEIDQVNYTLSYDGQVMWHANVVTEKLND